MAGGDDIRSGEMVKSAVAAPHATIMGEPFVSDPVETVAAELSFLCSNLPFVDGNKRVALASGLVFLRQNEIFDPRGLDGAAGRIDRESTTARSRGLVAGG